MKKNGVIHNLILAIQKAMKEMESEYTYIKIEKNTIFSYYKIEIRKD